MDALKAQVGLAGDATPDQGIGALYAEVGYQPAFVWGSTEAENGAFKVYIRQDELSGAHISYLVTTPSGTRGATAYGTIGGSDWSHYVDPNTTYEHTVGADNVGGVTAGPGLTVDPTE